MPSKAETRVELARTMAAVRTGRVRLARATTERKRKRDLGRWEDLEFGVDLGVVSGAVSGAVVGVVWSAAVDI